MFSSFLTYIKTSFKILFIIAVLLQAFALLTAIVIGAYLYIDAPCDETERARMTSPDGRTDAVLIGRHCGATTGLTYKLFFVRSGAPITSVSTPVLVKNDLNIVDAVWRSPEDFVVIYRRDNLWMSYASQNKDLIYSLSIKKVN